MNCRSANAPIKRWLERVRRRGGCGRCGQRAQSFAQLALARHQRCARGAVLEMALDRGDACRARVPRPGPDRRSRRATSDTSCEVPHAAKCPIRGRFVALALSLAVRLSPSAGPARRLRRVRWPRASPPKAPGRGAAAIGRFQRRTRARSRLRVSHLLQIAEHDGLAIPDRQRRGPPRASASMLSALVRSSSGSASGQRSRRQAFVLVAVIQRLEQPVALGAPPHMVSGNPAQPGDDRRPGAS